MFSLIQTALENGLASYRYLTWLMNTVNDVDISQEDTIRSVLPWDTPAECRAK